MEKNEFLKTDDIDLRHYLNIILRRFYVLLFFMLAGLCCAVVLNYISTTTYKATALLLIDKEHTGKIAVTDTASFSTEEDYYRTQYKLLESYSLLEEVYKQMELSKIPGFGGGVDSLRATVRIEPVTRSRLVHISSITTVPELSAAIANSIAENYIARNISNRVHIGQDIIDAINSAHASPQQRELLNSLPQVVNNDLIRKMKMREAELSDTRSKLAAKYTNKHPEILSLTRQIGALRGEIAAETKRIIESIKIESSGQFYGNNIRIVDMARVPKGPFRPRKTMNILIGLGLGLGLGLLLSFLIDFTDHTIKSVEDLANFSAYPFWGLIPLDTNTKRHKEYDIMTQEEFSPAAENVRALRTTLDFTLAGLKQKTALLTSALDSEGKTYLTSNLAVAIAQTNAKILLIDGDLRRPRLHGVFREERKVLQTKL